jgi:hypothetical protein
MRLNCRVMCHLLRLLASMAVLGVLATNPTLSSAAMPPPSTSCAVGQTTQIPLSKEKLLTPVFVLACGSTGALHTGPLEILGFDSSAGLCSAVRLAGQKRVSESCEVLGVPGHPFWRGPLQVNLWSWRPEPSRSWLSGAVDSGVAEAEVRIHRRDGQIYVKRATMAEVSGELLAKLNQTEPFGLFATVFAGCVPPHGINVVARNAAGELLASQRAAKSPLHFCSRFGNINSE